MNVFIPCNPGDLSINTRDRGCIKKGRIVHNEVWTSAVDRSTASINEAIDNHGLICAVRHPCKVSIDTYWPRRSNKYDGVPYGDVDSPVKALLDTLTKSGFWLDDMLCMEMTARKHHAADGPGPGVEIGVLPWR